MQVHPAERTGRRLSLDGRTRGACAVLRQGHGVGIAREEIGRIFERFYQVNGSPGAGSEFTVALPVGGESPLSEELLPTVVEPSPDLSYAALETAGLASLLPDSSPEAAPAPSEGRATVLVVEDNPDMRDSIRKGIAPHYRVIEAGSGEEGLARARENLPRLVI